MKPKIFSKTFYIAIGIVLGLVVIAFLLINAPFTPPNQKQSSNKSQQTFFILSDTHFLAPELHDDGKAFTFIKGTAAGKDLDYQKASLEAFVATALRDKPDGIIITGDLTLNGEKISAEKMVQLFAPLADAKIPLYCIPGNHDIHDGWARKYQGSEQKNTPQISPEDFKKIFSQGYQNALATAPEDLSYSLSINADYRLILLDSNLYTRDDSGSQPVTQGKLRDSTLKWLKEQLEAAKEAKQHSLLFIHHNLLKHNPTVYKGYVLENAETVKKLLKDYDVPAVFSGHIHAQDIMQEDGLTEIVSSSFAIIDHGYGVLTLSDSKIDYQRKTISVSSWAKSQTNLDEKLKKKLSQHDDYLYHLFDQDGQRLAYQTLMEQGIYDEKTLEPVAQFVGQTNIDYFRGTDFISDEKLQTLKQQSGYQLLAKHSDFLKDYVDFALQDHNLNDQKWRHRY